MSSYSIETCSVIKDKIVSLLQWTSGNLVLNVGVIQMGFSKDSNLIMVAETHNAYRLKLINKVASASPYSYLINSVELESVARISG